MLHITTNFRAIAATLILAMTACVDGVSKDPKPDASMPPVKNPVMWTPRAGLTLTADDFYLVAGGTKYLSTDDKLTVKSDPGSNKYTTLEVTWMEAGVEMRFTTYLRSDGTTWWSDEIRTYNGMTAEAADWIYYHGAYFASPVGQTFTGNLDLTADQSNAVKGSIHFENLKLSVAFKQS